MRTLYFYLTITLLPSLCFSQSTSIATAFHGNIKKADKYFDHFAYRNALHIYLHAFDRNPKSYHVRERIAECYFKLHDPVSAERWYHTLANEPDIHANAKFEYAETLSMNGKYEESMHWFKEYLKDKPDDRVAQEKLAFLKKIKWYLQDSLRFDVLPVDFNTEHSEYGAHYFHEGIVYASSNDTDVFIKHKPFDSVDEDESLLNMYYVGQSDKGKWGKPQLFHHEHIKTVFHEGPMAFYDNDRKGAFTRTNIKNGSPVYDANGRAHLHIFLADVDLLGSMSNIVPFEYNNSEYSTAHPTFSKDGTVMYFSSTAPGGYGGSDLYYSVFRNGKWSEPVNAGPEINTPEDESFPYMSNDTTLFFSSNGHGTLGGLDILVSYKRNGAFTKPNNFGGLINTRYDDFSFACDSTGRVGFIASNRPGGKGLDDIYTFVANYFFVKGEVTELEKPENKIPEAEVVIYNEKGEVVDRVKSDEEGGFILHLPFDQDYKIRAEKDGYESLNDVPFSTKGKPFGVDSLVLPLWKHNLFAKGRVFSNETEKILPGATVTLHNLTDNKKDSLTVDDKGEYKFLVVPEKNYRIDANKSGHIPNGFNLNTKGLRQGDLLNDIVLEEVFIDKEVIHFDFDKFDLTEASKKQMDNIVRSLRRNPKATLSIGAHADSRGTPAYNMELSNKRANAALQYFVSKGIARWRIKAVGFGEEFLLNQCSDGVECPEEEHSKNRRGEIKVQ